MAVGPLFTEAGQSPKLPLARSRERSEKRRVWEEWGPGPLATLPFLALGAPTSELFKHFGGFRIPAEITTRPDRMKKVKKNDPAVPKGRF